MDFNDGFKFSQQEVNDLTTWATLHFIRKKIKGNRPKVVEISGIKLIEIVLEKFGIKTFDFYNPSTYRKIEKGIIHAISFLVENKLITTKLTGKDKFYRELIKVDLYRLREFSNEFEVNEIVSIMYRINISLEYVISREFLEFYNSYTTSYLINYSHKRIIIEMPESDVVLEVLALREEIGKKLIEKVIKENDYETIANYIACYYKDTDSILVFPTKKELSRQDKQEHTRVFLLVNMEGKLKDEFKFLL